MNKGIEYGQLDFPERVYRLKIYYSRLVRILEFFYSGYFGIEDEKLNIYYLKVCNEIEDILNTDGFEDLRKEYYRPKESLYIEDPEGEDINWEYGGRQNVKRIQGFIDEVFIKLGERIYALPDEHKLELAEIDGYIDKYLSEKRKREKAWEKKLESMKEKYSRKNEEIKEKDKKMEQDIPRNISIMIGNISNFFGSRSGKYNIHRVASTFGYSNQELEGKNKAEIVLYMLRDAYKNSKENFSSIFRGLIDSHNLNKEDISGLNVYLKQASYQIKNGILVAYPSIQETTELVKEIFPSIGDDAKLMAESYIVLYTLENTLREFMRDKLKEKFGDEWWEKGIPKRIRVDSENRKAKEINSPWHDVKKVDMLWYTTFEELERIIQNNWDIFQKFFFDQQSLIGRLKELEIPRNTLAHNRLLEETELERLKLFSGDIFKCIYRNAT